MLKCEQAGHVHGLLNKKTGLEQSADVRMGFKSRKRISGVSKLRDGLLSS